MSSQLELAEQLIKQTETLLNMQRAYFERRTLVVGESVYSTPAQVLAVCKRAEKKLAREIEQYWKATKLLKTWVGSVDTSPVVAGEPLEGQEKAADDDELLFRNGNC